MKADVLKILKEVGRDDIFTETRYQTLRDVMKIGIKKDEWLKMYLSLDPLNRAQWIADHMIKYVDLNKI